MTRHFVIAIVVLLCVWSNSCFLRTSTSNVRGKVSFEGKPVVGAEVRLGTKTAETSTRTNYDGSYLLGVTHRPAEMLELKVIWPGYVHDKIEFSGFAAADKPIDIELKKVFTPIAPTR